MISASIKKKHTSARLRLIVGSSLLLCIAGCHKAPSGQTVATVNGNDITVNDLNLELNANHIDRNDKAKLQKVLQAMIERRLFAAAAQKDKIDKDPGFVLMVRRQREALLAQSEAQRATSNAQATFSQNDVSQYIDQHPQLGPDRRMLELDQVRFPLASVKNGLKSIARASSLDQAIAMLTALNVQYQRERGDIDTSQLPDDLYAQLSKLQPGAIFATSDGATGTIGTVTGSHNPNASAPTADQLAKSRMHKERAGQALAQIRSALRGAATIQYAAGYQPAPGAGLPPTK